MVDVPCLVIIGTRNRRSGEKFFSGMVYTVEPIVLIDNGDRGLDAFKNGQVFVFFVGEKKIRPLKFLQPVAFTRLVPCRDKTDLNTIENTLYYDRTTEALFPICRFLLNRWIGN